MAPRLQSDKPADLPFYLGMNASSIPTTDRPSSPGERDMFGSDHASVALAVLLVILVLAWAAKTCFLRRLCSGRQRGQEDTVLVLHFHDSHRGACQAVELWRTPYCPSLLTFLPKSPPRKFRVCGILWPKLRFRCPDHLVTNKQTGSQERVPTSLRLPMLQALGLRGLLSVGEENVHVHYEWRHQGAAVLTPLTFQTCAEVPDDTPRASE